MGCRGGSKKIKVTPGVLGANSVLQGLGVDTLATVSRLPAKLFLSRN